MSRRDVERGSRHLIRTIRDALAVFLFFFLQVLIRISASVAEISQGWCSLRKNGKRNGTQQRLLLTVNNRQSPRREF